MVFDRKNVFLSHWPKPGPHRIRIMMFLLPYGLFVRFWARNITALESQPRALCIFPMLEYRLCSLQLPLCFPREAREMVISISHNRKPVASIKPKSDQAHYSQEATKACRFESWCSSFFNQLLLENGMALCLFPIRCPISVLIRSSGFQFAIHSFLFLCSTSQS